MLGIESVIIISILAVVIIYQYILLQNHKMLLINNEKIRQRLYETSEKISKTNDEDKIYSAVLDTIIELIPNSTKGSVLLYNDEDEKFYYKVTRGYNQELQSFSIKKEESYLYIINQFKETAIIHNIEKFYSENIAKETIERFQKIHALDISCTLSAPIYADKRFIGMINVDSSTPGHVFTKKDLDLMDQIKCELELAIKNALAHNRLKYLANYDELTGLINRRKLIKEFDKEVARIKHNKNPLSIVMIDLDDFKDINDTYGHYYGDLVLKRFSEALKDLAGKSNVVARFAGDEFVILFRNHDYEMTENIMKAIKDNILSTDIEKVTLSFSYGICQVSNEQINFDKALVLADAKMYREKKVKVG